jgi:glucosamine--fructose-6-phosphate aminotransferase (isomerizing)
MPMVPKWYRRPMSTVWQEAVEIPQALAMTAKGGEGPAAIARMVRSHHVTRIVAAGNGASLYLAHYLWLLSLAVPAPVSVVAVPAALLATGWFPPQEGDMLLGFSSSGELSDLIGAMERFEAHPRAVVTAEETSTLARVADLTALVRVRSQLSMTHTQSYCGAALMALAVWARLADSPRLETLVRKAPDAAEQALVRSSMWIAGVDVGPVPTSVVAYGSGFAWPAALEAALLMREIAGVAAEGTEASEGGTSAMFSLTPDDLVLSLHTRQDRTTRDADEACRARGARIVVLPGGTGAHPILAPVTTFFDSLQIALKVAARAGRDPDIADWKEIYLKNVRTQIPARKSQSGVRDTAKVSVVAGGRRS